MFSARLKSARANAGISQTALAKAVGRSQSYLAQLEAGDRTPSLETIKTLATALGVSPGWLMGGDAPVVGRANKTNARFEILADEEAPPGLRAFALDMALAKVMSVKDVEWKTLRSVKVDSPPSKDGYVALLQVLRAVCPSVKVVCDTQDDSSP